MTHHLMIDRFEGSRKQIAVLVSDDGVQVNLPKKLLPRGAKAGDVLAVSIDRDIAATARVADETRQLRRELREGDPGEDLKL